MSENVYGDGDLVTVDDLSANEKKVLLALKRMDGATVEEVMEATGYKETVEVMSAASWLKSKGLLDIDEKVLHTYTLASRHAASRELPERRVLKLLVKNHGVLYLEDLRESGKLSPSEVSIALGWMKRKGWVEIKKEDGETMLVITPRGEEAVSRPGRDEEVIRLLANKGELREGDIEPRVLDMLKKRKEYVKEHERVERRLHLTEKGWALLSKGIEIRDEVGQLTPRLLSTGGWRGVDFRRYDVTRYAPPVYGGRTHPLRDTIEEVRTAFLEMGFTEIKGGFVETAFWNMDVLFIPQDHPARDLQDTFYVDIRREIGVPGEVISRVAETHENGGKTGSKGWQYRWRREEAERVVLRTHTTVNTIRYLYEHPEEPCKVFSIERVFRNESIDATHLPEFYQIEGIVMEEGANFRMLIGLLKEFYRRLGFEEVRIRPAYFPYTEPSMEVEVRFGDTWLELGGSGIFRPEVTIPLGIKYPVLAWGLGLERLTMMRLGLKDLRDLYISDLDMLRKARI